MKKFLTIFAFCFLLLAFSSPARAQTCPSGGVWTGTCCDYKDSTHLIPDPDPEGRCSFEHCQEENFDPNPGGLNYGGECKYCNPNVCKHGSACEATCNWSCCSAGPPPDCGRYGAWKDPPGCCSYYTCKYLNPYYVPDTCYTSCHVEECSETSPPYGPCQYCEPKVCKRDDGAGGCAGICSPFCCHLGEDCYMPDENLTTCCEVIAGEQGLWQRIISALGGIDLPFLSLTVTDFEVSKKFAEETDYYYGSMHSEFEPGVLFRLAPPNFLEDNLPTEEARIEKRQEDAKYTVELDGESGGSGEDDALNDGKLKNVEPYVFAVESLRNFLVATPKKESATSQKLQESTLASLSPEGGEVLGEAVAPPCLSPVKYEKTDEGVCIPKEPKGTHMELQDLLDLFFGDLLKLFPKIADLDKIGHYTAGVETDGGGDARQDKHYEDGGMLEIFKIPGEEYEDRTADASALLKLKIGPITISLGKKDLKLRHQGADTLALEDKEKGVWAKLTVPQAGNGTTAYKSSEVPAVVLASAQNPLDSSAPLNPLTTPLNISFAERLGRTLGTWLGKLITL